MQRIIWFILGLASIFFFPWWMTLFVLVFGFFYFSRYYEGIILGLIYDGLYFTAGSGQEIPVWFFGALILFFLIYYIKPALR